MTAVALWRGVAKGVQAAGLMLLLQLWALAGPKAALATVSVSSPVRQRISGENLLYPTR